MARKKGNRPKKSVPSASAKKLLYRSARNKVLLGVLGGLAEYLDADPIHVRMAWAAFIIIVGLMVGAVAYALVPTALTALALAYVIAYLLMNEPPAEQ